MLNALIATTSKHIIFLFTHALQYYVDFNYNFNVEWLSILLNVHTMTTYSNRFKKIEKLVSQTDDDGQIE